MNKTELMGRAFNAETSVKFDTNGTVTNSYPIS